MFLIFKSSDADKKNINMALIIQMFITSSEHLL